MEVDASSCRRNHFGLQILYLRQRRNHEGRGAERRNHEGHEEHEEGATKWMNRACQFGFAIVHCGLAFDRITG